MLHDQLGMKGVKVTLAYDSKGGEKPYTYAYNRSAEEIE